MQNPFKDLTLACFLISLAVAYTNAATPANIPNLSPNESPPDVPDFTAGDPIGDTHDWNLGPTGARGWMWGWKLRTDLARQIYVTSVAAGSPAALNGKLKVGDVILGIDGNLFTSDARIALANAITEAEKTANNGALKLTRWRAGTTTTVTLTLPVMGSYSDLSPYNNCSKSAAIMQKSGQYLASKGLTDQGVSGTVNALGLLATGDTQYSAALRTYARGLTPATDINSWMWVAAYQNLFLCEYYLSTGDTQVLPKISQLCTFIIDAQNFVGTWGHGPRLPNGIHGGYGALNQVGLVCSISLVLAKKCGIANAALDPAIQKSAAFLRRYVGRGTVPYGDHTPSQLHDDNGKNSLACVFFDLIGDAEACSFFGRMVVASYGLREMGHTGNYFSYLWGPLGAMRSGQAGTAAFLREQFWFFDLERQWNGGYTYQGGAGERDNTMNWDVTGARLLMYAMPLKKLYITGKSPSSMPALTGAELDKTILSGRDFNVWYFEKLVTRDKYDDLTQAQLLARLDTWSCEERSRAAQALSRKSNPPIDSYRAMIKSNNRDTILGGLVGLKELRANALPALPDVQPLLAHNDLWIQHFAGKVTSAIGPEARDVAVPIQLNIAGAPPAADDPRGFRGRFAAYNLWGDGDHGADEPGWGILNSLGSIYNLKPSDQIALVPAVRKTIRHEHSIPRNHAADFLGARSFDELAPFWFDMRYAVENMAETGVMFSDGSRAKCFRILVKHRMKEALDAGCRYMETQHLWPSGAARNKEILDAMVGYGTEAQRILPRLYGIRNFIQETYGPGKPFYDMDEYWLNVFLSDVDTAIAAIENATVTPTDIKSIYDYSIAVLMPPSASPAVVDVGMPTTLSITAVQGEDLPISYTWSKLSGPGVVTFGTRNSVQTTATFSEGGLYELRVTMQDAHSTKTATVSVLVGGVLAGELGRLDLSANGGINPATGSAWRLGDSYRLVFVSSASTTAVSKNLSTYDTFVQNLANNAGLGDGDWKVIGSSRTEDARDHTATNPNTNGNAEAVILIDGRTVIANNYADLWDGSIDATINMTEQGTGNATTSVFTGTYPNGVKDGVWTLGGSNDTPPSTTVGRMDRSGTSWVRDFGYTVTSNLSVYAISKVLRIVPSFPATVDAGENQTVALTGAAVTPTPGADIYLNAALDNTANTTWEDSLSAWNLTLGSGVTRVANIGSSLPGITAAYDFPGGVSGAGGATGTSFNSGWDAQPVSIEIWFKPDSAADDGQSNGQILFETGGSTGMGIFYNDGTIEIGHSSTEVISSVDVSALINEFIQVVLTYDETNFVLYVNGSVAATGTKAAADWSGSDGAGLGARGGSTVGGRGSGDSNTESFEGAIAIFRAYRDQVLTGNEVLTNYRSIASYATANLNGTVSSPGGGTPPTAWSDVSGPGSVSFNNASAVDTAATFLVPGIYVLRLTAGDPNNGPVSDTVTVTVIGPAPAAYVDWANGSFTQSFSTPSIDGNPDGDNRNNLMEFAFGTDPTINDVGLLANNGSRNGDPLIKAESGGIFEFYFVRRKDHGRSGSIKYTVCFSNDLATFYDNNNTSNPVVVVAQSSSNSAYEVVKVRFPSSLPSGKPAKFSRVRMEAAP